MDIYKGKLVKTLSGHVVKAERETAPGYWLCDDQRIHLAASFREVNAEEHNLYVISHGVDYISNGIKYTNDPEWPLMKKPEFRR